MEDIKPKAVDSKPQVDAAGRGDDEDINLTVVDQCRKVQFWIKKSTPFRKLMDAYCKKLGLSKQAVRFTFDGRRLQEQDRPEACGVEDGDEIDVFQEQPGVAGGASLSRASGR